MTRPEPLPFGQPKDYPERTRFVRNPPPELLRMVRASDLAANQLRRSDDPSRLERITTWAAIGLASMICIYFAAQFLRLAL